MVSARSFLAVFLYAWLLWIPTGQGGRWQLRSAYTFRATCLVVAVWWDLRYKSDDWLDRWPSWCLPVGVNPNRLKARGELIARPTPRFTVE